MKKYRSFDEARTFVHSLKLSGAKAWRQYCKSGNKPDDIPYKVDQTYKEKGWSGWSDFLGPRPRRWRSFEDAREFSRSLNFKSVTEWNVWKKSGKRPRDIPKIPNEVYKNKGWTTWGDFLGTGRIATKDKKYRSFKDARKFVRKLKLKNVKEWAVYCKSGKKPDDIPTSPSTKYKKEWKSFGDFLGTGTISPQVMASNYLLWKEAKPVYRRLAKEYGLKNNTDWERFARKNKKLLDKLHLPTQPWIAYSKERVWRKMK